MNLDNKKNIAILLLKIILLLAIIGFIYIFIYKQTKTEMVKSDNMAQIKDKQEIYLDKKNIDTDGDGISDWKEIENMTDMYVKNDKDNMEGRNIENNINDYDEDVIIDNGRNKITSIVKPDGIIQEGVDISKKEKMTEFDEKTYVLGSKFTESNKTNNVSENSSNSKYKRDINKIILADIFNGNSNEYIESFRRYVKKKPLDRDRGVLERKIIFFKNQKIKYQALEMETFEMRQILKKLIKYTDESAIYLSKIKDFKYQDTIDKKKEYTEIFGGYSKAIGQKNILFYEIHKLLKDKKIKFESNEPGVFFEFRG